MNRNHPIRQLLDWLGDGGTLTDDDLAELDLPSTVDRPTVEQIIRTTADAITTHRRDGRRDLARRVIPDAVLELDALIDPTDDADEPVDVPDLLARIPRR